MDRFRTGQNRLQAAPASGARPTTDSTTRTSSRAQRRTSSCPPAIPAVRRESRTGGMTREVRRRWSRACSDMRAPVRTGPATSPGADCAAPRTARVTAPALADVLRWASGGCRPARSAARRSGRADHVRLRAFRATAGRRGSTAPCAGPPTGSAPPVRVSLPNGPLRVTRGGHAVREFVTSRDNSRRTPPEIGTASDP